MRYCADRETAQKVTSGASLHSVVHQELNTAIDKEKLSRLLLQGSNIHIRILQYHAYRGETVTILGTFLGIDDDIIIFSDGLGVYSESERNEEELKTARLNDVCAIGFTGSALFPSLVLGRLLHDEELLANYHYGRTCETVEARGLARPDLSYSSAKLALHNAIHSSLKFLYDNQLPKPPFGIILCGYCNSEARMKVCEWNSLEPLHYSQMVSTFRVDVPDDLAILSKEQIIGITHDPTSPGQQPVLTERQILSIISNSKMDLKERIRKVVIPFAEAHPNEVNTFITFRRFSNGFRMEHA